MRFIGRVLRDAFRLLAVAPLDLILTVAALHIVGAVLALDTAFSALGLAADFAGATLLVAGLVGTAEPDRLAPAASRVARRIGPVVRQLLVQLALFVGLAALAGLLAVVVVAVAGPSLGVSFEDFSTISLEPTPEARTLNLIFLVIMAIVFVPFFGRLMPSTALVLAREVGAVDSLRQSWAATRGRTIALAVLFLLLTAPGWLLIALLPTAPATFLTILTSVLGVAAGVAVYRQLEPVTETPSRELVA